MGHHQAELPNDLVAQREAYYEDLNARHIEPLWRALATASPKEPRVQSVPYIWRWKDIRSRMLRASDLITPQEAERRVLMLINPSYEAKTIRTVGLIYAGIQLVMPGEVADSHRHSPNAQRFIIEGAGGYTTVDGERTNMNKGDFVLTPGGAWHDHGNDGTEAVMWLDGLDLPFVNILDANFFEDYEEPHGQIQPIVRPLDDATHRYGRNLRPTWVAPRSGMASPMLNYRWTDTRQALHELRDDPASPFDGVILQYVNPVNGGPTLPTISASLQLLRKGEHTKAHRHTSSTIYHVAEGGGRSIIGGKEYTWEEGDTFVVPSWSWHEHEAIGGEAVLFSYTDRPIIDAFGLYREEAAKDGYQS